LNARNPSTKVSESPIRESGHFAECSSLTLSALLSGFKSDPFVITSGTAGSGIEAGARSGRVSFFADESYEGRVSLEAYPVINELAARSLRLMLSAGVAAGTFVHELLLPESFRSASDAPSGPPRERILRPEIRLQTSVGFFLSDEHGAVAIALSPWVLLRGDDPTSLTCVDCDGPGVVTDYGQTWGVALTIAPSVGSDFMR